MKRLFTTCTVLFLTVCLFEANAQIGINTMDPDPHAVLDIRSDSKGVKLPSFETLSILGTPPNSGYLIYYSPDKKFKYWNGTYWESVNPLKADASENVTASNNLNVTGTATANNFVGYGTIPIGGIIMWSGTGEPGDEWALCDGRTKNGYTTPDLKGRFIVGYDASKPDYNQPGDYSTKGITQGKTGGKDTLTLKNDNLPTHSHGSGSLATEKNGTHSHLYQGYYAVDDGGGEHVKSNKKEPNDPYDYGGEPAGEHIHQITGVTGNAGGIYTPPKYIIDYTGSPNQYIEEDKCMAYIIYQSCIKSNGGDPSKCPSYDYTQMCKDYNYNPNYGKPKMVESEKWAPQPFDNRPPYYVLAFIMRIK